MKTSSPSAGAISEALQKISYGYHVLTTRKDAHQLSTRTEDFIAAGTVCWVSQVSFEPPLLLVAVQKESDLNETIQKSRVFALNVLGKDNLALIEAFSHKPEVEDRAHQINHYAFEDGPTGSPLLADAMASLDCRLTEVLHTHGDHALLIGEIVEAIVRHPDQAPITDRDAPYRYKG